MSSRFGIRRPLRGCCSGAIAPVRQPIPLPDRHFGAIAPFGQPPGPARPARARSDLSGHEVAEAVEEVRRVVGAGGGLGVVLDREGDEATVAAQLQPLDHVVVEAHVGDAHVSVGSRRGGVERCADGEPVVVRGHLDLAGGAVHHRLVDPPMAVGQLVGLEAEGAAEELVAEADPEVRDAPAQCRPEQLDLRGGRGRIARTVGEEQPVRRGGQHVVQGRRSGQDVGLDAARGHHPGRVRLDPEVDGGDAEAGRADRRHDVRLGGGDLGGEVRAGHLPGQRAPARAGPPGRPRSSRSPPASRLARAGGGSARGCRCRRSRPRPARGAPSRASAASASSRARGPDRGRRSRPPRSARTRDRRR